MASEGYTFIWAPEIEVSTVATIWHEPERCADFLRVCDPLVHLTQPHLRIILEAINLALGEAGCADWAIVVEVIRQLGKLEECGGLEGLNAVYSAHEPTIHDDPIFAEYVRLLQEYAEHRQMEPARPVARFSGGRGSVYRNKAKRRPLDADYTGEAIVRGIKYQVRAQVAADGEFLNFWLEPKTL